MSVTRHRLFGVSQSSACRYLQPAVALYSYTRRTERALHSTLPAFGAAELLLKIEDVHVRKVGLRSAVALPVQYTFNVVKHTTVPGVFRDCLELITGSSTRAPRPSSQGNKESLAATPVADGAKQAEVAG